MLANLRQTAFRLDLRSLALCRIAAGLVILGDLLTRAESFRMHYTDVGILPRQAMFEMGIVRFPSLYMASGWEGYVAALFVVHGLVALTLTLGYQTRVISLLAWYLTISLQQRTYMTNNGGDTVLALLLFWGLFVPWGETMSIDAAARPIAPTADCWENVYELSVGTALMAIQLPAIYWISVFHKTEPFWLSGQVLYYAFQSDFYSRPIAQVFLPYASLMKALAYSTMAWEALGPFLLLSGRPRVRIFACAAFAFMHLNFGVFLRLGIFAFSPLLFLAALLPSRFWHFAPVSAAAAAWRRLLGDLALRARPPVWRPLTWTRELRAALIVFFVYGSLVAIGQDPRVGRLIPRSLDWVAQVSGLFQRWSVFVNLPEVPDGWFVVEGKLSDGSEVDLFQGFSPVRWDKPATPYSRYDSFRWPTPMVVITGDPRLQKWFVRALALDWQHDHPGQKVVWARFNFMKEKTEPGFQDTPAKRLILWQGQPTPQ